MTLDDRVMLIRGYVSRGWAPVPVPARSKNPGFEGWERYRVTMDAVEREFPPSRNVGLILGEPSGGLVDVDLDSREAIELAPRFLPATQRIHGRAGKPASHWWYVCDPAPALKRFQDVDGASIVEFRSTGGQTIVPPSDHVSGEAFEWERGGEPAVVDGRELLGRVERLAACALLARHWPAEGGRHDAAMAVAGALLRHEWPLEDVRDFIVAAARVAGDPELRDRERAIRDTEDNLRQGRACTGLPRLAELIGERVVERLTRWLELRGEPAGRLLLREQPALKPAIEERRPWRDLLSELPLPVGALPYWFARLVNHVRPYTPMFPDDWAVTMTLPFWSALWPGVRMQNLNLAIWALGIGKQGIGKNVATDELMRVAKAVVSAAGGELTPFTAGTPEGMWDKLAGQNKRMLCYHDEYAGFLKLLKRDHMTYAREALCSLYDGRIVGYQRAQKNSVEVIDPHVAVAATVNKPDIEAHASPADLSNGYLSRFMICAPDAVDVLPDNYPFPHDPERQQLVDELSRHLTTYRDVTVAEWQESGRRDPELVNLYRAHLGFGSGRTIDLDAVEDEPTIPPGRLVARVKKIAVLLELGERFPELGSDRRTIMVRPEHVATAIDVVERSRAYTQRMMQWIGASSDEQLAEKTITILQRSNRRMTARELCQRTHTPINDLSKVLSMLELSGAIDRARSGRAETWGLNGHAD